MATSVSKTVTYSSIPFDAAVSSSISGNTISIKYSIKCSGTYVRAKGFLNGSSFVFASGSPWSGTKTVTKTLTASGPTNFVVGIGIENGDTGAWIKSIIPNTTLSQTPASYTVSYNANGGTGVPVSQTKYYGTNIALSSTKPTRTGYTFAGWATSSTGAVAYAAGATYSANASATLYAKWTANRYTITFNANGGANAPAAQTKTYDSALTLTSSKPTKERYNFKGWAKTNNATTAAYQPGATFSEAITSNITLYAVWELAYIPPVIDSLSVVRCDSSGNDSGDGEYMRVNASWHVDTVFQASNSGHITGSYEEQGGSSSTPFALVVSGTSSGTASAIVPNISADKQYLVTVTATDDVTIDGKTYSGTRTTIITKAIFVLDFSAGGNGIGIGCAAPRIGLDIGYENVRNTGLYKKVWNNTITGERTDVDVVYTSMRDSPNIGGLRMGRNNGIRTQLLSRLDAIQSGLSETVFNALTLGIYKDGKRYVELHEPALWRSAIQSNTCATAMLYGMANVYSLTNSASKLPLSTYSEKDPTGLFSSSSNGIKVARSGSYLVSFGGYVYTNHTVGDLINTRLYRDSTAIQSALYMVTTANPYATSTFGPILVSAEAGQTFYLYAYNQNAARGSIGTGLGTYLTVTAVDVI